MGANESIEGLFSGNANFSNTSFAEGRSRRAYKGTYRFPLYKAGDQCVVKELKEKYAWAKADWDSAVKVQEKSMEMAKKFNEAIQTSRPIEYVRSEIWKVTKSYTGTPRLGEWCMVEDYIQGQWKKWNTNAGYVSDTPTQSLHAFSHWTWVHSGGKLVICDLQGVRYDDKYVLTDPAINSLDKEYGESDIGVVGMAHFFDTHKCTSFCSHLPKPCASTLEIGQLKSSGIHKHSHTSYSSESKFSIPQYQKERLRQKLISVPGLQPIAEED